MRLVAQPSPNEESTCSFLDTLRATVKAKGDAPFATWYDIKGDVTDERSFATLWNEAGVIADHLRNRWNVQKGQHVILCYNFGLHFFASFLGCLRAGVVAILVYPPGPPLRKSLKILNNVVKDCHPVLILIDSDVATLKRLDELNPLSKSSNMWPKTVSFKVTDRLSCRTNRCLFEDEKPSQTDVAFLQYTSGSTGEPKGVMVSFGALAANVAGTHSVCKHVYKLHGPVVGFSWVPQYHDMGLVSGNIHPFAAGYRMHMMSPMDFLKNPTLWVELMSRYSIQWSVAPDFSFRLATRKFNEARSRNGGKSPISDLDLSSINFIASGAEPLRVDTREIFLTAFSEFGLCDDYYVACYGMAENVLGISTLRGLHISSTHDHRQNPLVAVGTRNSEDFTKYVKIVNPDTREALDDGETGEIWVSGPSVAAGYYGKEELTRQTFAARIVGVEGVEYLRTGDLGFFENDFLYVCGRSKDIIIVNGVNYYPQDIESVVEGVSPAVRAGCIAAFSRNETDEDGELCIMFEVRNAHNREAATICDKVRAAVSEQIGLLPSRVVSMREKTIPKTTSGKIKRRACRELMNDETRLRRVVLAKQGLNEADHRDIDAQIQRLPEEGFDEMVRGVLGAVTIDPGSTWDEIGLSSMLSVQLREAIEGRYRVVLPPDCFENYDTPAKLEVFVNGTSGKSLEARLPSLYQIDTMELSWTMMCVLQTFGVSILLLLFSASIIPAWHVGQWVSNETTNEIFNVDSRWLAWLWVPFAVPTFMITFTFSVVCSKWLIVGSYKESEIPVFSVAYLRWWWVDRAVDVWEFWVGRFLQDTVLLWLFYRLCGAKIHYSVRLNATVREFDLVSIGENAEIHHQMWCRRFSPWDEENGPMLRFRSVSIKNGSKIYGTVGLGSVVGEAARVEWCSVVPEGGIVPANTLAKGNPAFDSGSTNNLNGTQMSWKLEALKLLWFVVELYNFFALILVAQLMYVDRLPQDWRYTRLCYWFLYIATATLFMVGESIILKWVLIGKRRAGPTNSSLWRMFAVWAADFHFKATVPTLLSVSSNCSLLWNSVLKLMGMDIDYSSNVVPYSFLPSNVDLISIRESFSGIVSFEVEKNGTLHQIEVIESSIGHSAHVGPGAKLSRVIVSPLTLVGREPWSQEHIDKRASHVTKFGLMASQVTLLLVYTAMLAIVLASLVPAYEIWMEVVEPETVYVATPVLALAIAVQTCVWVFLLKVLQYVAYGQSKDVLSGPPSVACMLYLTYCFAVPTWSFLRVLFGSPLYNVVARFLGTTIEGRVLYFGRRMYDWSYITMRDKTIVDDAFLNGHFLVYQEMTVGQCYVSGVVHEGVWASVGGNMSSPETGPFRAVLGAPEKKLEQAKDDSPV